MTLTLSLPCTLLLLHTLLVSHLYSHTLTISHSFTHYCILMGVMVPKLNVIFGIEVVLVTSSPPSPTFLPSNCMILTLSHSYRTPIGFVWEVNKYLGEVKNMGLHFVLLSNNCLLL